MQLAAAHHHAVDPAGDLLEHRGLARQRVAGLVHVGQADRGPDGQAAGVGLLLAHDHAEERGLACAVRADHADDAARREDEVEVVDQQPLAEALLHAGGVDHLVAQAGPRRDGQLDLVGPPLGRLGLGHQLVVGGDAGLALALAGPGRHADPVELALERGLARPVRLLLDGQAGLLLLQPGGVVAFPGDARPPVELEDPAGHVVEEVAVVGDGHHGARVLLQRALQPGHRLGVEVVGRLVEQQEVRLGEEQAAQRDPAPFAARERGHVGVARRQAQGVHGDLEGALEVPGARGVDLGLQVGLLGQEGVDVGVGRAERRADVVVAVHQRLHLAHPVGHVPGHVLVRVELGLLGQVADGEAGREPGLAAEAVVLAGHDAQQRGLARSVGADHADLRPRIEGQVDALEHLAVGRIEACETAHGVDELGGHGDQCAPPGASAMIVGRRCDATRGAGERKGIAWPAHRTSCS